jgi:hypothetical protein
MRGTGRPSGPFFSFAQWVCYFPLFPRRDRPDFLSFHLPDPFAFPSPCAMLRRRTSIKLTTLAGRAANSQPKDGILTYVIGFIGTAS